MNTVQLECFLSVAQHLNFSKAAEDINITQPAVSHQISSLEDELGTKLFIRTSKNVQITEAGIQFLSDAESIMRICAEAKSKMASQEAKKSLSLTVGCHNQIEFEILSMILKPLLIEFPTLSPTIKHIPFKAMENLLDDNKIQVLFGFSGRDSQQDTIYTEIKKCKAAVVCSEDYDRIDMPFADIRNIKGRIILGEPHKIPPVIFQMQKLILENRASEDICFGDEFESVMTLVKAGMGFSVTADIPMLYEKGLKYIPIENFPPISVGLYYKKDKNNIVLNRFIETAQKILL